MEHSVITPLAGGEEAGEARQRAQTAVAHLESFDAELRRQVDQTQICEIGAWIMGSAGCVAAAAAYPRRTARNSLGAYLPINRQRADRRQFPRVALKVHYRLE